MGDLQNRRGSDNVIVQELSWAKWIIIGLVGIVGFLGGMNYTGWALAGRINANENDIGKQAIIGENMSSNINDIKLTLDAMENQIDEIRLILARDNH